MAPREKLSSATEEWCSPERKDWSEDEDVNPQEEARELLHNVNVKLGEENVPILRPRTQIDEDCVEIKHLGQGLFGTVTLVHYRGQLAVKKVPCEDNTHPWEFFIDEGMILYRLDGAGGAPKLMGLAIDDPAIILSYCEGKVMYNTEVSFSITDKVSWWLKAFISLTKNVMEIHELGCIHNDLHAFNVLISHSREENSPVTRLIDFGLSQMETPDTEFVDDGSGNIARPESDINGLGAIIKTKAIYEMERAGLMDVWNEGLRELTTKMTDRDHSNVPPLSEVYQELNRLLVFNNVRRELQENARQILRPQQPRLNPIQAGRGVRVVRRPPFRLVPARPLHTCQRRPERG